MVQISTSVLGVNEENSIKTFYNLETAKTDYFHIDVMDGEFVENNTEKKMRDYALKISHISNVPLDVHLMCKNIKKSVEDYIDLKPDKITFHVEAIDNKEDIKSLIKYLHENGIKVGIAIKPNTNIEDIYEYLPYLHMVLIMTVEPGEGGQKLICRTIEKVRKMREYLDNNNFDIDIEVDGGINDTNAKSLIEAGANILVSGNFIINSDNFLESIEILRKG